MTQQTASFDPSALLELACTDDSLTFWSALVAMLQTILPYRLALVWSNFSTMLFRADNPGDFEAPPENTADCFALHAGGLYNHLNRPLIRGVFAIDHQVLAATTAIAHPLLVESGCVQATTLIFGETAGATVCLYHHEADRAGEFRTYLTAIFNQLDRIVTRFLAQTERQTVSASAIGFLRDLPIGLILLSWQMTLLFVNKEGYRQTYIWNTAPNGRMVSEPRMQFSLPADIKQCLEDLKRMWITNLRQALPLEQDKITLTHRCDPTLKAVIGITCDRNRPLQTPNFTVRFSAANARSLDQVFEPTSAQVSVLSDLTPAERSVAVLVMRGLSNREVAETLNREVSTIKDHLSRIYSKLSIESRSQLVRMLTII